jgi:sugar phosphate permease
VDGIIFFFKNRSVRDAIFFLTSTQAVILVLATITPGFVDKVLLLDIKLASLVLVAPAAAGMIVGSFVLGYLGHRFKERQLVNVGLLLAALSFLALSFLQAGLADHSLFALAIILIALLGVATSFVTVPATTELQAETPERFRGRTYGILGTFGSGISVFPVLAAGAVSDVLGIRTVLISLGALTLAVALYRLKLSRYT